MGVESGGGSPEIQDTSPETMEAGAAPSIPPCAALAVGAALERGDKIQDVLGELNSRGLSLPMSEGRKGFTAYCLRCAGGMVVITDGEDQVVDGRLTSRLANNCTEVPREVQSASE